MDQITISVAAVVLTIGGYIPYLRDVSRKKTRPHSFTWFIATLAGFIAYGLKVLGGGNRFLALILGVWNVSDHIPFEFADWRQRHRPF